MSASAGPADAFRAIESGDAKLLRALLVTDPGLAAARDPDGTSAVRAARYRGATELVAILQAAGPPLDVADAAAVGDLTPLRELLEADPGAIGARSNDGWTPLHLAAFFDQPAAVRLLLDAGADVSARAERFGTPMPLHSAAAGNSTEPVRLLLAAGADPNAAQAGGWRPLHSAARNGNIEMVRVLLAGGADPTIAEDTGRTPAAVAGGDDEGAAVRAVLAGLR